MPLNQTSILTSAQGRQLAQRRWQSAAFDPAASTPSTKVITDIANPSNTSIMKAMAMAGMAGFAAYVICELIRRKLSPSVGTQTHPSLPDTAADVLGKPPQTAVLANGQGWSVLIALAIAIGVFIVLI